METFMAIYICMSGPTCPKAPVAGNTSYYSQETCASNARLIAQGMFVMSGDKYGYRCDHVAYEPPNLGAEQKADK